MSAVTQLHPLGPLDRIPVGEARVFRVDGKDVAVFRCRSGEVFATSAECPHRGGPLADGLVGGHSVICPMHGFAFDLRTDLPAAPPTTTCQPPSCPTRPMSFTVASAQLRGQPTVAIFTL